MEDCLLEVGLFLDLERRLGREGLVLFGEGGHVLYLVGFLEEMILLLVH